MKHISLGTSGLQVPAVAVGCMRLAALDDGAAEIFVQRALELGANFFDHADIYGDGESERRFAKAVHMSPAVREKLILQSKCGIRPGRYDFSRAHILASVDGILERLQTEYLDVLLLHRPDMLMEPEEVAEAFSVLHSSGKVRHFGVSNMRPMQIELLKKYLPMPIVADQLQLSITNAGMMTSGIHVNMTDEGSIDRDGSVLDYCRLHDITIQPWSPFQYGFFEGVFLGNEKFPALNAKLKEVADAHGVSETTVAAAWLLRHPAKFQPVFGTTNPDRLAACAAACDVTLSREEWYAIYLSAGNNLP